MAITLRVVARRAAAWLAAILAVLASPVARATNPPGLAASAPEVVDNTRTGYRSLLALGVLEGGGHALAWLGRDVREPQAPWQLWVQRHDRLGRKAGAARQLAYTQEAIDPRQVAAAIRRDGTVAVAWATVRPYQPNLQGLRVSAVHARHFGLDGKPRGAERVLEEALWLQGQPDTITFEDLVMAHWPDGRYLVGWTAASPWHLPAGTVQRLAADGRPLAPPDRLGPMAGRGMRLLTLEAGGWLAGTLAQSADGRLHANITQVDVRPPIGLPLLPSLPLRSFVVDLGTHGRLLLAGLHPQDAPDPSAPPAPWSLWFTPQGREADLTSPLPALPTHTVTLGDGTWIGLWPFAAPGRLWAQRFDARGTPLGGPVLTAATRAAQALRLPDGSALLAWVGADTGLGGGTSVFLQRLAARP